MANKHRLLHGSNLQLWSLSYICIKNVKNSQLDSHHNQICMCGLTASSAYILYTYRVFHLWLYENKRLLGHQKCTFKS